jgi:hypothetical protein
VRSHPAYEVLAHDPVACCDALRRWVGAVVATDEINAIRFDLQRQQALGTDRCQQRMGAMRGRRAGRGLPERPRKSGVL